LTQQFTRHQPSPPPLSQDNFRILQRRYHRWYLYKNKVASQITNFIRCQLARQRLALYRREFNAARTLQCMYRVYRARLAMWDRRCIGWEFMHQGLGPQRLLGSGRSAFPSAAPRRWQ
jgi:hypothetical protein